MDLLSFLGVILGFAAVLGGNFLEGGHITGLLNGPAALIVFGGTIGAGLLQTPYTTLRRALYLLKWIIVPPTIAVEDGIRKVVRWSLTARKEGLLGLETITNAEADLFSRKGLQLLVDGSEPEVIRNILEVELYVKEQKDIESANFYEAMGGYAPTIGILGAVMGLIHVMENLAEPALLGPGIAVAFVATIYGVGIANLLMLPIAGRIKSFIVKRSQYQEMILEGILSIAEGENPRSIETKLYGYVDVNS